MRRHLVALLCTSALAVATPSALWAQTLPIFQRKIDSPPPLNSAQFGFSLGSFNGNLLVGAIEGDSAAYLMNINTGAKLLTLISPDAGNGALSFGGSVIQVGQNIAVGDYEYNSGSNLRDGSAYIFNGATGQLLQTIRDPSPATFNNFSASIQSVAGNLWINSQSGSNGSSGLLYAFNPANGQLLNTITNPEAGAGNWGFGFQILPRQTNVYISALGAPVTGVHAGAVYRYDATTLNQTLKISNPVAQENAQFGFSLAQNNTQLLVGAPNTNTGSNTFVGQAYLFDPDTGALLRTFSNPEPNDFAQFGQSVALFNNLAFIGAPGADLNPGGPGPLDVGAFYVFDVNSGNYLGRIVDPDGQQGHHFSLGFGANGGLDVIGAQLVASDFSAGNGSVYVYSVPESSALILSSIGVVFLLATRWFRWMGRQQIQIQKAAT
jgi:hypothetical protein